MYKTTHSFLKGDRLEFQPYSYRMYFFENEGTEKRLGLPLIINTAGV